MRVKIESPLFQLRSFYIFFKLFINFITIFRVGSNSTLIDIYQYIHGHGQYNKKTLELEISIRYELNFQDAESILVILLYSCSEII